MPLRGMHTQEAMFGDMSRALECGAWVEDGAVVLQGELVESAIAFVERTGAQRVVSGSSPQTCTHPHTCIRGGESRTPSPEDSP